jgi:hypothetical protein
MKALSPLGVSIRRGVYLLGLLVSLQSPLKAQQVFPPLAESQRPHLQAEAITESITIDGQASEAAWQRAASVAHFTAAYPKQGQPATYDTEVKVLYDSKNLYISAVCQFPPGKEKMQVQNMRRDFSFSDNELFEIVIDPFKDARLPVMCFAATPYGTQMDIMHYADGSYDYKWDAVWKAASRIQAHSWTVELAIPFATLRYPDHSTEWSINFVRNIRHIGELNGWSPWPLAFSESRMEYAGIVTGIVPPGHHANVRLEPYVLLGSAATDKTRMSYQPQVGGEVKYALNGNTLLAATVNTDFAQAEVDRQVVNLTRSSVFFPEKRQFFLENSSLFSVGQNGILQPFFSRRIGISDQGTPLPISGGLRLVHQDGQQSVGVLLMHQRGDSTHPGALFGALRYKRAVTRTLQLGGMAVLRASSVGDRQAANPVGVVDAFWRLGPSLFVRGMASASLNTPTGQRGVAAFSEVNYASNSLQFGWFETLVSAGYQAQTGFVARQDFLNTQPRLGLLLREVWFPRYMAFFTPQLTADVYHQASTGNFQEANLNVTPFGLTFTNLGRANVSVTTSWQRLTTAFEPVRGLSIAPAAYRYTRFEGYVLSNQGAPYSVEGRVSSGGYYDGRLTSYFVSLRAAPLPHLSAVLAYTRNDFHQAGGANVAMTTHLLAPELRLAVNPRVLLSGFYQYNTNEQNGALNARFSWEYRPLSFVYFVFNTVSNYYSTPLDTPLREQNSIIKITYICQL